VINDIKKDGFEASLMMGLIIDHKHLINVMLHLSCYRSNKRCVVTCVRHVMEDVTYSYPKLRGLEGKSYFIMDLFCLEGTYK
jgi:hypothetical protein